jgi:Domain of unknown function (DUF1707)
MDDRMRTSEADREQAAARLREHFAEGRLTADELDERITAVLSARTYGDLRRSMADLPGPVPVPPRPGPSAPWPSRPVAFRRGPRVLPLLLVVLIAALVLPHAGWLFFGLLNVLLLFWLVALVAGVFAIARFRRHVRRYWQSGDRGQWQQWHHWHQYQGRG